MNMKILLMSLSLITASGRAMEFPIVDSDNDGDLLWKDLESGGDIHARDCFGMTPLMCASQEGDTEKVKQLIQMGARVDDYTVIGWRTALFFAVGNNHLETVKILIEAGANVNARTMYTGTPLAMVTSSKVINKEMEQLLLEHGARVCVIL